MGWEPSVLGQPPAERTRPTRAPRAWAFCCHVGVDGYRASAGLPVYTLGDLPDLWSPRPQPEILTRVGAVTGGLRVCSSPPAPQIPLQAEILSPGFCGWETGARSGGGGTEWSGQHRPLGVGSPAPQPCHCPLAAWQLTRGPRPRTRRPGTEGHLPARVHADQVTPECDTRSRKGPGLWPCLPVWGA